MIIIDPLTISVDDTIINSMNLTRKDDFITNNSLTNRLYITYFDGKIIISDRLKELINEIGAKIEPDAADFYMRYGFILPPYTLYSDIFIMAPYIGFSLSKQFGTTTLFPDNKEDVNTKIVDYQEQIKADLIASLEQQSGPYNVLFSAGVDSAVLLGIAEQLNKVDNAVNCFMSSMPDESNKAGKICESKQIPIKIVSVSHNLESQANTFLNLAAEPISDKISLVIPAITDQLELDKNHLILDGQGADSLLCGLPHDRLYDLYHKKFIRFIAKIFSILPIWGNKKTKAGRLLYRITKILHCLSSPSDSEMLLNSLVEERNQQTSRGNIIVKRFYDEIEILKDELNDFHMVIRYIFMFRIIPAREMQKYIIANNNGYRFKLPFLENNFIEKHFYIPSNQTIKYGIYKYPMIKIAQTYWPGFFNDSKTSPFQVDFSIGNISIKELSLLKTKENTK
ncbi:asparagine synthase-related protein [Budvicia diplopodorum]|uniref:asparagine synthase-related protein n=1 Tax=Budvicia diplopodorum TaxID=1119056 RepID=UPI00135870AD|nr:asparagine synthase-related protein [Budvicia diplopodorum]